VVIFLFVKLVGLNRGINNKSIQITYKFQVLAVGKKTYDKNPSIHIQNSDLNCEKGQKLKLLRIKE
jgi:hypothetical protein